MATLVTVPLDDELSDYVLGKSEELGDAGQIIGFAGVVAAIGGVLLATPFVVNDSTALFRTHWRSPCY